MNNLKKSTPNKNEEKEYFCFQCGKVSILESQTKEQVNNSFVITSVRICSDPECHSRTQKILEKEKEKRVFAQEQKTKFETNKKQSTY